MRVNFFAMIAGICMIPLLVSCDQANTEPLGEIKQLCQQYATEDNIAANEKAAYMAECIEALRSSTNVEIEELAMDEASAQKTCKKYAEEDHILENEKAAYITECVNNILSPIHPVEDTSPTLDATPKSIW